MGNCKNCGRLDLNLPEWGLCTACTELQAKNEVNLPKKEKKIKKGGD